MLEDNKYSLDDLVSNAVLQKPLEFETAFDSIVLDRIRDSVENKKVEIARQMYGYNPENDDKEADFDIDSGEEENGEAA